MNRRRCRRTDPVHFSRASEGQVLRSDARLEGYDDFGASSVRLNFDAQLPRAIPVAVVRSQHLRDTLHTWRQTSWRLDMMSDITQEANLEPDSPQKVPVIDRAIAVTYLTTVSIAMIGWLYMLARAVVTLGRWMLG